MARKTGHIPDHQAVVDARVGFHLHPEYGAMRAGSLPTSSSNRQSLPVEKGGPGVLDQHDTSSCEGHAHASAVTLRLALAGAALSEVVSPVGLYLGALLVDRVPNADGTLPPLVDQGTMPQSIQSASQLWGSTGASVWGQYPASSQSMYLDPANAATDQTLIAPKEEQLLAERSYRLRGMYFIQSGGNQRLLDALSALASGRPVSDAIPAGGPDFQGYAGGVLGPTSGDVDHANLILDYSWSGTTDEWAAFLTALAAGTPTTTTDSMLTFYGVNSWGTGWGESDVSGIPGGMYRFNRAFFDQSAQDPCVVDVSRAA
jgi:hypothetical protein